MGGTALAAGSAYAYFWDGSRADAIAEGVQIAGIDVGGLRAGQARQLLEERFQARLRQPVQLQYADHRFVVRPTTAGVRIDVAAMVDAAVRVSRRGGLAHRVLRDLRGEPVEESIPLRAALSSAHLETLSSLQRRYHTYILVSRETFTLRLYKHLKLVKSYRIAVGQAGLETPAGEYTINDKQVNPWWHVPKSAWAGALAGRIIPPGPADPLKSRWLGFYNGAGIHGTDATWSIGTAASHGCIRMTIPDVEDLYERVPLRTPIYVG